MEVVEDKSEEGKCGKGELGGRREEKDERIEKKAMEWKKKIGYRDSEGKEKKRGKKCGIKDVEKKKIHQDTSTKSYKLPPRHKYQSVKRLLATEDQNI